MKIKKALNKLFSHNEIIALWCETNKGFKVLLWRGEAWKLSEEYKNLRISRIFGTIPETITQADTINILIKAKPIPVACTSYTLVPHTHIPLPMGSLIDRPTFFAVRTFHG